MHKWMNTECTWATGGRGYFLEWWESGKVQVFSSQPFFFFPLISCVRSPMPQSHLQSRRTLWTRPGLSAWWCCCLSASGRALRAWSPGRSCSRPFWFSGREIKEVSRRYRRGLSPFWWISAFGPKMTSDMLLSVVRNHLDKNVKQCREKGKTILIFKNFPSKQRISVSC